MALDWKEIGKLCSTILLPTDQGVSSSIADRIMLGAPATGWAVHSRIRRPAFARVHLQPDIGELYTHTYVHTYTEKWRKNPSGASITFDFFFRHGFVNAKLVLILRSAKLHTGSMKSGFSFRCFRWLSCSFTFTGSMSGLAMENRFTELGCLAPLCCFSSLLGLT